MANTAPRVKTAFLHCRFNPKLKDKVQRAADREGVSVAALVEKSLVFYLRTKYSKASATDAPTV
jgi:predicted HicB family RNase H-like nuclease